MFPWVVEIQGIVYSFGHFTLLLDCFVSLLASYLSFSFPSLFTSILVAPAQPCISVLLPGFRVWCAFQVDSGMLEYRLGNPCI